MIMATIRTALILNSVDVVFGTLGWKDTQVQRKIVVTQLHTISHIVRLLLLSGQAEFAATDEEGGVEGEEGWKGIVAARICSMSTKAATARKTWYGDRIGEVVNMVGDRGVIASWASYRKVTSHT